MSKDHVLRSSDRGNGTQINAEDWTPDPAIDMKRYHLVRIENGITSECYGCFDSEAEVIEAFERHGKN